MFRALLIAVVIVLHVVMLIDCARRHPTYFADSTPRVAWFAILMVPLFGPLAYMITMLGKPGPA